MKRAVLLSAVLLASCGKKAPEREANVPDANPPAQPPAKTPIQPKTDAKQQPEKSKEKTAPQKAKLKVEPIEVTLTPGIEAAKKAHKAGNYREAVRLYTNELIAVEANPASSWVQLSHLNNKLGMALHAAGQYDNALEHFKKSLAIKLKQLGPEHPSVAISYGNMAYVYKDKKDLAKAKGYWEKAYAIHLKKLGPNHPDTKKAKAELDALKE